MDIVKKVAFVLLIVGGLNWGLVGLFGYNLVSELFNEKLAAIVYVLVGISALIVIFSAKKSGVSEKTEENFEEVSQEDSSDSINNQQM